MIPLRLQLSGFLSYRDPVEVDFSTFDLACISGHNGAGKSSLLDAITWVLFGQARRRDDALINSRSKAAEVVFDFIHEGNTYRVQRSKPREKPTVLEFLIRNPEASWKPLTEHTLRETEGRIQQTLRMDYEIFSNASFFLQGKADQFTQQRPSDRKRILTNVLGLEVWETYRQETNNRRKAAERELAGIEGQIQEIETELAEEDARRERLKNLETELERLSELRKIKEHALENLNRLANSLEEQHRLVEMLSSQALAARERYDQRQALLADRMKEWQLYQGQIASSEEIENNYAQLKSFQAQLSEWDKLATRFQEHQQERNAPLITIEAEQSRLNEEHRSLAQRLDEVSKQQALLSELDENLNQQYRDLAGLRENLAERKLLNEEYLALNDQLSEISAENKRLRDEMKLLKERIDRLQVVDQEDCPLCGQPLGEFERLALVARLEEEGKALGDRFRQNQLLMQEHQEKQEQQKIRLLSLANLDELLQQNQQKISTFETRKEYIQQTSSEWEHHYAPRLHEVEEQLREGRYASQARLALEKIDHKLRLLGYNPAEHDAARQAEQLARPSEDQMRLLETARAALGPLEREIASQQNDLTLDEKEMEKLQVSLFQAREKYQANSANLPDLTALEQEVYALKTQENQVRMFVGGARQSVEVLAHLQGRKKSLNTRHGSVNQHITRLKTLERAFGKDGVPALLIEQALPEIEAQTNEYLDRLSNGRMSVKFATQRDYKDKNRDDRKETLDILINDPAGTREYEMFSGGEAFRVNFAIRLALSRVLAHRAGARLQTLVIDEGFGNQDSDGRQRLIESIHLVHSDFAKILVITHLEELKDAFPTRIEVEKNDGTSTVRVMTA